MKNFLFLLLLVSPAANAVNKHIRISGYYYPSPFLMHMSITQDSLVDEAMKACGGRQNIVGLSRLKIVIQEENKKEFSVGTLETDNSLLLFYPRITASALVSCK